jgi:acetyl-CoA acetyltransferase
MTLHRKAAIVGVAEADEIGIVPNKSALQLHAEAARNALEDAGIDKSEVDAYFTAGTGVMDTVLVSDYLGIIPRYSDSTQVGGSSFELHVEHAAAAIAAGLCNVALITHGQTNYSDRRRAGRQPRRWTYINPWYPASLYEGPHGAGAAPSVYAMAAMRHMYQYGTTSEQLAELAVATRKWAQLNPKALMRDPLTVEDVLNSRYVAYPLHKFDCCLVTDAGGAAVVVGPERARDTRKKPVWLLGAGEASTHFSIFSMPDLTVTPAKISGAIAFEMADVRPEDIDVVEVYDSFTYTTLVALEDLGFCKKGEGGPFVSDQRTAPGGEFPLNTSGGGLSYTHPGMFGMFLIIEAVRQLRGECGERQVPDARLACVNGTGGTLSSCGTLILGVD